MSSIMFICSQPLKRLNIEDISFLPLHSAMDVNGEGFCGGKLFSEGISNICNFSKVSNTTINNELH